MNHDPPSVESPLILAALNDAMNVKTSAPDCDSKFSATLLASDSFAGYALVEEIHRGGQGIVFRARQESTGRDVAIKVMREGPFSGQTSRSRFEREVQILARLKHPNIATIHESAFAGDNQYFVMDYIAGEPLDVYVSRRDWSVEAVIRLFARVCKAVNAAHLRGIIHRDLKPSNILIDEAGEPHILDFGLAKFESDFGGRTSAMTQTGQFVGSLPWASPEQAGGTADRIDLRTDVYALGVILYQVLTGKFPYRVVGGMRDVLSNILEAEPTRLRSIRRELDSEIETIALKCLEKDPERRYQSAGALAEDVERFLQNQPILARPATTLYQLKKLVVRNRLSFSLVIALFFSIIGFSVWMAILYSQADRLRIEAVRMRDAEAAQRVAAEANLARAESAERTSREAAHTANEVVDFLVGLFEISDPDEAKGETVTAREILDRGAATIREELADQAGVRARMMSVMGAVYRSLGLYDAALPLLEESLKQREALYDGNDLAVAETLTELSALCRLRGEYERSQAYGQRALTIRRATLGADHEKSLASLNNLALVHKARGHLQEAEVLLREYVDRVKHAFGDKDKAAVTSLNNLALLLEEMGRYDEAGSLFREALDRATAHFGARRPITLEVMGNLGRLLHERGEMSEAEQLLREAVGRQREVLGDDHPSTQSSVTSLGLLLRDDGRLEEAESLLQEAADVRARVLGTEHPDTLTSINNLALLYLARSRFADAEKGFRRAWEGYQHAVGDMHPLTVGSLANLAAAIKSQDRFDEAEPYYRMALANTRVVFGEDHPDTLVVLSNLASLLKAQGKLDAAEPLLRRVVEAQSQTLGPEHAITLTAMNNLASVLKANGKLEESEKWNRATLEARLRQLGDRHLSTLVSMNNLAKLLMEQKRYEEAEGWFRRARLGDAGEPIAPTSLRPILDGNHGTCLVRLGRFDEAEPLLLGAYESFSGDRGPTHARTVAVVEALIELYTASGKPGRAAEFQALLTPAAP